MTDDRDAAVRLRAFEFLTDQRRRFSEASIPRSILERGFDFEGVRVPLIGPQGIFKPAILPELPLTITTAPPVEHRERPYDDGFIDAGFLRYRYRGTDPSHRDNVGLRTAMQRQTPLIADVGRAGVQISERQACADVLAGKLRKVSQDLVLAHTGRKVGQDIANRDARSAHARLAEPNLGVDDDPALVVHSVDHRTAGSGSGKNLPVSTVRYTSIARQPWRGRSSPSRTIPKPIPWRSRSFPTASRSASSTTPPSTATSSASRPTSRSPCASTCWKKSTGRCSSMACRAFKASASTCRAPTI